MPAAAASLFNSFQVSFSMIGCVQREQRLRFLASARTARSWSRRNFFAQSAGGKQN
jgi:hypothetical protein